MVRIVLIVRTITGSTVSQIRILEYDYRMHSSSGTIYDAAGTFRLPPRQNFVAAQFFFLLHTRRTSSRADPQPIASLFALRFSSDPPSAKKPSRASISTPRLHQAPHEPVQAIVEVPLDAKPSHPANRARPKYFHHPFRFLCFGAAILQTPLTKLEISSSACR